MKQLRYSHETYLTYSPAEIINRLRSTNDLLEHMKHIHDAWGPYLADPEKAKEKLEDIKRDIADLEFTVGSILLAIQIKSGGKS